MTKRIVLCADDYGQTIAISQAILNLIQAQRLSATSCLMNMPDSTLCAKRLREYHDQVDIGLHVNLTEGESLAAAYQHRYGHTLAALPRLMGAALLHMLDARAIAAECHAQLDKFIADFGFPPRFIDGHQHVHQFPQIRSLLLDIIKTRLPGTTYLRLVRPHWYWDKPATCAKQMVITFLGAQRFKKQLQVANIAHNTSFSGMYAFAGDYGEWFQRFLQESEDRGLIMCHPSLEGEAVVGDSIAMARYQEYQYLTSTHFSQALLAANATIHRFLA